MQKSEIVVVSTVVWEDAAFGDHIATADEVMDDEPFIIVTSGLVVQENRKYLAMATDLIPDDRYRHISWIPKRMILSRQDRKVRVSNRPAKARR